MICASDDPGGGGGGARCEGRPHPPPPPARPPTPPPPPPPAPRGGPRPAPAVRAARTHKPRCAGPPARDGQACGGAQPLQAVCSSCRGGAHIFALLDGDALHAGHGLHAQLLHGFAALLLRARLLATAAALLPLVLIICRARQGGGGRLFGSRALALAVRPGRGRHWACDCWAHPGARPPGAPRTRRCMCVQSPCTCGTLSRAAPPASGPGEPLRPIWLPLARPGATLTILHLGCFVVTADVLILVLNLLQASRRSTWAPGRARQGCAAPFCRRSAEYWPWQSAQASLMRWRLRNLTSTRVSASSRVMASAASEEGGANRGG